LYTLLFLAVSEEPENTITMNSTKRFLAVGLLCVGTSALSFGESFPPDSAASDIPTLASDEAIDFSSIVLDGAVDIDSSAVITSGETFPEISVGNVGLPPTPEPGTWVLFGSALVGLGLLRRKRIA
jgi:hypothetical protein